MKWLEDYNYHLPEGLIAQQGVEPRDSSRLMVIHRDTGQIEHRIFHQIAEYLRPGDVLVLNQSKVIPARLFATNPQGTPIEVLLVREIPPSRSKHPPGASTKLRSALGKKGNDKIGQGNDKQAPISQGGGSALVGSEGFWEAMLKPAKRARGVLSFADGLEAEVVDTEENGTRILHFSDNVWEHLDKLGQTPLPPYIHEAVDAERYQTIFAKIPGSVAAPTAGLHFTPGLLRHIREMGIEICYVTLHVGPGTFQPIKDDPDKHVMHLEAYEIPEEAAAAITQAKSEGRRIVAVGTTVVRTLESAFGKLPLPYRQVDQWLPNSTNPTGEGWGEGLLQAGFGETQLFIRPGFEFKVVNALVTNFHLPKSTLLMLVAAFAGYDLTMHAYKTAVEERYRFYSLGDAMFNV